LIKFVLRIADLLTNPAMAFGQSPIHFWKSASRYSPRVELLLGLQHIRPHPSGGVHDGDARVVAGGLDAQDIAEAASDPKCKSFSNWNSIAG